MLEPLTTPAVSCCCGDRLKRVGNIPLGCSKTPLSTPAFSALLNNESNILSLALIVLLALTYFLSDWRLCHG